MGAGLDQEKAALRAAARRRRQDAAEAAPDAGPRLAGQLFEALGFGGGLPVSGYWPIRSELDIRPSLERLVRRGHPLGLPVVVAKGAPLIFRLWRPGEPLVEAGFGTSVPTDDRPEVNPRVLLVPLLSFDRAGYRLGYGGGFYDRTMAALRARQQTLAVGVAFAAQEIEAVPRGPFDQPLDWIVTESEAIQISGQPGR